MKTEKFTKIVLEGEIGCGKTTLLRNILGEDVKRTGGFITARVCEQELLQGFVLAPVEMLSLSRIRSEDVRQKKLHCFLSFCDQMQMEEQVFSNYAAEYLKKAVCYPAAVLDEIGGVELLEDKFYEELVSFLQADLPWICVLKSEKSAETMCRQIQMGDLYWKRYRAVRELLESRKEIQKAVKNGFEDRQTEQILKRWKECSFSF